MLLSNSTNALPPAPIHIEQIIFDTYLLSTKLPYDEWVRKFLSFHVSGGPLSPFDRLTSPKPPPHPPHTRAHRSSERYRCTSTSLTSSCLSCNCWRRASSGSSSGVRARCPRKRERRCFLFFCRAIRWHQARCVNAYDRE